MELYTVTLLSEIKNYKRNLKEYFHGSFELMILFIGTYDIFQQFKIVLYT